MAPRSRLPVCCGAAGAASPSRQGRRMPPRLPREKLEELCETTKLTPKEVRALYSRFRRLAPYGTLNKEQFRQTMGVLGLTDDTFIPDRMFKVFDVDQDEKLSFQEFATSLSIMIRGTEDEKLRFSFDMTAGHRGAQGIKAEDFHRLIQACNTMMSSLVAPSRAATTREDVDRLFHDLSSDEGGCLSGDGGAFENEDGIITLEAYKAAAQHDELFLQCLGLRASGVGTSVSGAATAGAATAGGASGSGSRRSPVGSGPPAIGRSRTRSAGKSLSEMDIPGGGGLGLGAGAGAAPAVGSSAQPTPQSSSPPLSSALPPGHHIVTQAQLDDLRDRVGRLSALLLQDHNGRLRREVSPSVAARVLTPSLPESETGDEDERWWTPLPPRRTQGPSSANHGAGAAGAAASGAAGAAAASSSIARCATQVDQVCAELDKVLSWCGTAEARGFGGADGIHEKRSSLDYGCPTPTRREISRDSSNDGWVNTRNVHKPAIGATADSTPEESDLRASHSRRQMRGQQSTRGRKRHRLLGPKKGLAVHFGHENWNMVLSMMIGIRMAVGRSRMEAGRELQPVDFCMKEKFSIIPRMANIFDNEVSKRVTITRFIDYAPLVFQRIRSSFGIQHDDYLRSVGPEQLLGNMVLGNLSSLAELSSEGKSGAFFYYTADSNYMLKTVAPKEFVLLRRMLKSYYDHIFNNHGTLLVRFLGLHCLSVQKKSRGFGQSRKKLYFVVMANMFNTPFEIHRRYDLKGSWVGRQTPPDKYDPSVALKDVDFQHANECIRIGEDRKAQLLKQLEMDTQFLASQHIIDYSLLLGIHELSSGGGAAGRGGGLGSDDEGVGLKGVEDDVSIADSFQPRITSHAISGACGNTQVIAARTSTDDSHGIRSPTCAHFAEAPLHRQQHGGMLSQDKKSLYFLGVIDILTPYDTFKVFEHNFKGLRYDRRGVSCCPPSMYGERFMKFMKGAIG